MNKTYTTFDSPLGELLITVEDNTLTGIYQPGQPNTPEQSKWGVLDTSLRFHPVATALHRYFSNGTPIESFPTAPQGTVFQKKVWEAVQQIPYGKTVTYKNLAESIGSPKSVRAVASAVANNPITVVIPCHRVTSINGDVKYSGGPKNKTLLLATEAGHPQSL